MANNFIKIDNLTGSIFGNVTINNYGNKEEGNTDNEAEEATYEEVKPQTSSDVTHVQTDNTVQNTCLTTLKEYICRLGKIVNSQYTDLFPQLVDKILQNADIQEWLLDTRRCNFKDYNKNRVFRLAQLFKYFGIVSYNKDIELNLLLEGCDQDTSYRKSLTRKDSNEVNIRKVLSSLINN